MPRMHPAAGVSCLTFIPIYDGTLINNHGSITFQITSLLNERKLYAKLHFGNGETQYVEVHIIII